MWDAPAKCHFQLLMSLGTQYRRIREGGFCFTDLLIYFTTHLLLPCEQLEISVPSEFIMVEENRENEEAFSLVCQPCVPPACH